MKDNDRIIAALNERLIEELTAIDQYSIHRATFAIWQYNGLVAYLEERIADETKHFNWLLDRIKFLGGTPAAGKINSVNTGLEVTQIHTFDKTAEVVAISNYNATIALCIELKDSGTRDLIEQILADEEDHLRDLEAQLTQLAQMGEQNYLSSRVA